MLTGKEILGSQTFRDLFRNEVISSNEGLTVRDITILFTDLKGSTALYDRIGDLKAFNLVQEHFDSLGKVIFRNGGAIVKTIGDAIMASFLSPRDAAGAALEMLEAIERFNGNLGRREIVLKVGIHRGASIAVTLNDRVDYFGQMVNVASRVQGLADADQICLTGEVFGADGVREVFRDHSISQESSLIKGVQGELSIYRVQSRVVAAA
jgi:class 3 adenylate cyclase